MIKITDVKTITFLQNLFGKDWVKIVNQYGKDTPPIEEMENKWTNEQPKEPGIYWAVSNVLKNRIELIEVLDPKDTFVNVMGQEMPDHQDWYSFFMGPLREPELPEKS